jgi:hypothetical protein
VTVTDCVAVPPAPVQVRVYVVVADKVSVAVDALVGSLPVQPPLAVQLVALVELKLKVMLEPVAALATFDVKVTVGGVYSADTPYRPNC